jgi:hypothetical protein
MRFFFPGQVGANALMNRLFFGLFWLALVGTALPADPPVAARNLVNGGTLDGPVQDSGLPAGWQTYPAGFGRYDCYTVSAPVRQGPRSLRLSAQEPWVSLVTGQHRLEPGTRQSGQAWVHLPTGATGDGWLRIDYLNDAGAALGSSPVAKRRVSDGTNDGWHLLKVESRAEDFPQATQFQLIAAVHGGGTVFWDDFELYSSTDVGK